MISFLPLKSLLPAGMVMAITWIAPFGSATANIGHVGEVAGHGHLVGIGLIAASAVLAGWLATREDDGEQTVQDDAEEIETGDEVNA